MAKQERRLNKRFVMILTIGVMMVLTVFIAVLIVMMSHKDPKIYGNAGDAQMAKKQYLEASRSYASAFRYSKNPQWLLKVAEAQYQAADEKKAMASLQTAVLQDPTFVAAQKRYLEILYEAIGGRNASAAYIKSAGMEEQSDKLIKMITQATPEKEAEKNPDLRRDLALAYHCRGLARYARRAETAGLEKAAQADVDRALQLDPKGEYLDTRVTMILGDVQDRARTTLVADVTPDQYDAFCRQTKEQIRTAEKLYLDLAGKTAKNPDVYLSLGNFYFRLWGGMETSLGQFCQRQYAKAQRSIGRLNSQLDEIRQSKTLSADAKRSARAKVVEDLTQAKHSEPEWDAQAKKHEAQAQLCNKQAKDLYQKAIDLAGNDNDKKMAAMLALAYFNLSQNQLPAAEALAREAIKADPDSYQAYPVLVDVLKQSLGRTTGDNRQKKLDETIGLLNYRIYEAPGLLATDSMKGRRNRFLRWGLMMELIKLYMERNRGDDLAKADKAIKELDQSSVAEAPDMYLIRGQRAILANDLNTAIIKLEKADKLSNERSAQVKFVLASLYRSHGDLGAARKAVEAALALAPDSPVELRLAAAICLQLDDAPSALNYAEALLAKQSGGADEDDLKLKLQCLVRLDRMAEADEVARKMKGLGSTLDWPMEKARLLQARGSGEDAEKLYRQRLTQQPGDKTASYYLADLLAGKNRTDEALKVLKPAIDKNPSDKGLARLQELISIGDAKKRAERRAQMSQEVMKENSSQALAKAQEEKDPFARAVQFFNEYARQNDLAKARQYLDEAMKLDPKRANGLKFRYALIQKDWVRAQECADLAKLQNLDSVKGLSYEAELANRRGWVRMMDNATPGEPAKRSEETKKYFEQSAQAAQQVINDLPNDAQAHALLAEAYYLTDRTNEAAAEAAKALALGPGNPYALRAQTIGQWEQILTRRGQVAPEVVRSFAANVRNAIQQLPWDDWLQARMSWLQQQSDRQKEYREDETGDARQVLARRQAQYQAKPADVENAMRLAWMYENRAEVKDLDKAEAICREICTRAPGRDALQFYYGFATRTKRLAGLETFLQGEAQAQAKAGKAQGYANLGNFYMMGRDAARAEAAFLEMSKIEDTPDNRLELASFYSRTGNAAKAEEWCRKALTAKVSPTQDQTARLLLVNALFSQNRWDQARSAIDEYCKAYPDTQGKLFRARLALETGQPAEAEKILSETLAANPSNAEARDYRSMVYVYTWKLDQARDDLEQLDKSNPRTIGRIKLIKLQCELGRTTDAERDARELIRQVAAQSPEELERLRVDMLPPLASALSEQTYDEMLVWASNLTRSYWGWPYERGQYFLNRGRLDQAEQAYGDAWRIVEQLPQSSAALKVLVLDSYLGAMFKQKAYNKMAQTAEKALRDLPTDTARIRAWEAAAYLARNQRAKGFELYRKALTAANNNPLVIWQMTNTTVLNAVSARELVRELEPAVSAAGKDRAGLQMALAAAYFDADDINGAAGLYRQLAQEATEPVRKAMLLYVLGQEYTEKHKYAEAAEALNQAKVLVPDNIVILNNLAYILVEYLNKPQEALGMARAAYQVEPNNPDILDTYGLALVKAGEVDKGLYNLTKSVWIRESSASRYHLGVALRKQNRRSDATLQLRRALQLAGDDKALETQIRDTLRKM